MITHASRAGGAFRKYHPEHILRPRYPGTRQSRIHALEVAERSLRVAGVVAVGGGDDRPLSGRHRQRGLPAKAHHLAVEIINLRRLQVGAAVHLGRRGGMHERYTRPGPDDPQLGQGRKYTVMDQQVTSQREDSAPEEFGIAHMQNDGEEWQVLSPPFPAEHYVAGLAALDQNQVTYRRRLCMVVVELQLRPG